MLIGRPLTKHSQQKLKTRNFLYINCIAFVKDMTALFENQHKILDFSKTRYDLQYFKKSVLWRSFFPILNPKSVRRKISWQIKENLSSKTFWRSVACPEIHEAKVRWTILATSLYPSAQLWSEKTRLLPPPSPFLPSFFPHIFPFFF